MADYKMPPIEKNYEVYSAVADGRIVFDVESAKVCSSDYSKEYLVEWKDGVYSSNDNASYWQGYPGYPIIVMQLMLKLLRCMRN